MTLNIKDLNVTLSISDSQHNGIQKMTLNIKDLYVTFSISGSQHNDIQQNDTQHKGLLCDTQHKYQSALMTQGITMP
jgi:hypothetical protein